MIIIIIIIIIVILICAPRRRAERDGQDGGAGQRPGPEQGPAT